MKFYLSHPIRGSKGKDATREDMDRNCKAAIEVAQYIRDNITPSIEIYVPAEYEEFVGRAYHKGYLDEKQILEIDCLILDSCDVLLVFLPGDEYLCGGTKIEFEHAQKQKKRILIFRDAKQAVDMIANIILRI